MGKSNKGGNKLTLIALILMIFTSVFGFTNIPRAFYLMGYAAIPWYLFGALAFFIPYAFMMAEFGTAFKEEKGIYAWMEKSVGAKFAFIGTFMWYASYVVWMVTVSSSIWVPLSNMIFGADNTSNWSIFGLTGPKALAVFGVILIIAITYLSSRGVDKISKVASVGGIFVTSANVVLLVGALIVLFGKGIQPAENFSLSALFHSPNPSYGSMLAVFAFLVYAIFAYGGLEAVGGLVDKTEKPEKNFPKGIGMAAIIIGIGYSIGIFMVGLCTNWSEVLGTENVNIANAAYIMMKNLGVQLGEVFGMSAAGAATLGVWFARYIGLSMFLALVGAFFTLIYSPLKQLIEGTPKQIWPKSWTKVNESGMPAKAMRVQCIAVIVIIFVVSFGGKTAAKFFTYLTLMSNVAMTLPVLFLAIAYIAFKKNDKIAKPFVIFKNKAFAIFCGVLVIFTVGFANVFTIIQPALEGGDYVSTMFQITGPIVFSLIALVLFRRYEKKMASGTENETMDGVVAED